MDPHKCHNLIIACLVLRIGNNRNNKIETRRSKNIRSQRPTMLKSHLYAEHITRIEIENTCSEKSIRFVVLFLLFRDAFYKIHIKNMIHRLFCILFFVARVKVWLCSFSHISKLHQRNIRCEMIAASEKLFWYFGLICCVLFPKCDRSLDAWAPNKG